MKKPSDLLKKKIDFASVLLASAFFMSGVPEVLIDTLQLRDKFPFLKERKWTGAGFVGSLWGAVTYVALPAVVARSWVAILVAIGVSVAVSNRAEHVFNSHDDSRIVIDEWVGCWVALWGMRPHIGSAFIVAFILFRVFDAFKGPLIQWSQRLKGGWGVTMDDVIAGVLANVIWRFLVAAGILH